MAAGDGPGSAGSGLGRLVEVDPRSVWPHEAHDFTPWLLDNADRLGEALGMDLALHQAEHPVGGFSLDLIGGRGSALARRHPGRPRSPARRHPLAGRAPAQGRTPAIRACCKDARCKLPPPNAVDADSRMLRDHRGRVRRADPDECRVKLAGLATVHRQHLHLDEGPRDLALTSR